eukprot:UN33730
MNSISESESLRVGKSPSFPLFSGAGKAFNFGLRLGGRTKAYVLSDLVSPFLRLYSFHIIIGSLAITGCTIQRLDTGSQTTKSLKLSLQAQQLLDDTLRLEDHNKKPIDEYT